MKYPPFFDLLALSRSVSLTNKRKKLNYVILQAWRAEACLGDLFQAKDCCSILRAKVNNKVEKFGSNDQTIVKALLTSAVGLYARATSTSGKAEERGSIQLDSKKLSKEQNEDHSSLVTLRNQALAHVNPEHKVGDRLWHKVVVFAVPNDQGHLQPAAMTHETSWSRETLERLERMLPIAISFLHQNFVEKLKAVSKALDDAGIDYSTFQRFEFDPVEVFGSDEIVQRILSSRGKTSDRFWVDE